MNYNTTSTTIVGIILSLIITIAIYSLPIIIYRYGILKHAVDTSKAKKITIIYAIIAFIIMIFVGSLLNAPKVTFIPLVFWSYINYKMLTSGISAEESEYIITCENCHKQYSKTHDVCPYCNTPH